MRFGRKALNPTPPRLKRRREEIAFLPAALEVVETPPSPIGRAISYTIIGLFCVALAWSCLAKVDLVASAQGRIAPSGRSKVIQSLDIGVVRAIHVQDGQTVKAGELLVELDSTASAADRDRLKNDWMNAEFDVARMRAALADGADPLADFKPPAGAPAAMIAMQSQYLVSEVQQHRAALEALEREKAEKDADRDVIAASIDKLEAVIPPLQQRVDVRKYLFDQKIGSKLTYLEEYQDLLGQQHDLVVAQKKLAEAEAAVQSIVEKRAQTEADYRSKLFADLAVAEQKAASAAQDLIKAEEIESQRQLTAPVDGVVQQLAIHTVGGVVRPAETLMVIVPVDSGLEVEASIANRDIGFVHVGDEAVIKVDTFNFTRYGFLRGKVLSVSADSIAQNAPNASENRTLGAEAGSSEPAGQELTYAARITLEQTRMQIDDALVNLSPGMAVTVEIKTGSRTVISYLLSPILKYGHEALRER